MGARGESTSDGRDLVVLLSFKQPTRRTNPYVTQLLRSLEQTPGVHPECFTWSRALLGRYDVFHAHWPESLIEQRGLVSTVGRRLLYALVLVRMWVLRIPVVRTVHNVELPRGISVLDRALLKATERSTRVRIVLNEFTPLPPGARAELIEHGHYRDWFEPYAEPAAEPGHVVFFGKIRRYKNVTGLVAAFRDVSADDPAPTLSVLGSPSGEELSQQIRDLAAGDDRIALHFGHVDDPDLVAAVGRGSLVVLPYPEMHNSGSVLAALSLGRPVLVPDNDFNRALADEVGSPWVLRYQGPLRSEHLEEAISATASLPPGTPDLDRRDWRRTGDRHLAAYRSASEAPRRSS